MSRSSKQVVAQCTRIRRQLSEPYQRLRPLTRWLHDPQLIVETAKSSHRPEQQPGRWPAQRGVLQPPQWAGSLMGSEQTPAQQAGLWPVHYENRRDRLQQPDQEVEANSSI
jgi:hypothetical protein